MSNITNQLWPVRNFSTSPAFQLDDVQGKGLQRLDWIDGGEEWIDTDTLKNEPPSFRSFTSRLEKKKNSFSACLFSTSKSGTSRFVLSNKWMCFSVTKIEATSVRNWKNRGSWVEEVLFEALNFDGDGFIKSHCLSAWDGMPQKMGLSLKGQVLVNRLGNHPVSKLYIRKILRERWEVCRTPFSAAEDAVWKKNRWSDRTIWSSNLLVFPGEPFHFQLVKSCAFVISCGSFVDFHVDFPQTWRR